MKENRKAPGYPAPPPPQADWSALERLRAHFLADTPPETPYWTSREDLTAYDQTFAERIRWKWQAVWSELRARGWRPAPEAALPPLQVYDWGCGSGVAIRSFLEAFTKEETGPVQLRVWDHSERARAYTTERVTRAFPGRVRIAEGKVDDKLQGILLISHVINELDDDALAALLERIPRASALIWLEAGSHSISRRLLRVREALRVRFTLLAPCPQQGPCGMLAEENAAHWCHHFAEAPREVFQSPHWSHFQQELKIDVGTIPYAFIAMDKDPERAAAVQAHDLGAARVIGKPRKAKGHCRALTCGPQDGELRDLVISRRAGTEFYRAFRKYSGSPLFRLELRKQRITGGEIIAPA